jgi:hypothetical protein
MDIDAQIAVVGHSRSKEAKASVRVTTRSGKVRIDIKGKTPGRYIDLDVYSKKGEFVLFSSVVRTPRLASSGKGADERSLLCTVSYFFLLHIPASSAIGMCIVVGVRASLLPGNIFYLGVSNLISRVLMCILVTAGSVTILLPHSFTGVIELQSTKGTLNVRSALAANARVLKSSDEDMLLLVGPPAPEGKLADFVRIASTSGAAVAVGYTVEDDISLPTLGFWRKFGLMLKGKNVNAVEKAILPAHK